MKKLMVLCLCVVILPFSGTALQKKGSSALEIAVARLSKAESFGDYQRLAEEFTRIARTREFDWLSYYYAALCNTNLSFLHERGGARGELYSKRAELQINQARLLLDPATQKEELSEVYVVISMINRAKLFINPFQNGREYGGLSQEYLSKAKSLNPANPRAIYLDAWIKYYLPRHWGGSKMEAKKLARQALERLPADQTGVNPSWGRKECKKLLM